MQREVFEGFSKVFMKTPASTMNLSNSLENNLIIVNTIMFFCALNRAVGNIMITPKQIAMWFNLTFPIDKNMNILLKTMGKRNYSFSR